MEQFSISKYRDFRQYTHVNPNMPLKIRDAKSSTIKRIVFHCTDATDWSPDKLSRFFVDEKRFPICGYHYYVTQSEIHHMVGENVITWHASGYNRTSVGFSINYFATQDERLNIPLDANIYANAVHLAATLCIQFKVPPQSGFLVGHRELFGTGWIKKQDTIALRKTCPGLAINLNLFRYNVCREMQTLLNNVLKSELVVDGIYGPKTAYALESVNAR